jgi:hypothetical protein
MEASRRFGADRRSGALELLLCTPLSVKEILRGQWLALLRQFGAAVALVCAVDFVFLGLGLKHNTYSQSARNSWIVLCLAGIFIFVFDLITLALLSMWGSLRARKASQAGITAIVRVCVVPWFLFGAFGAGVAILDEVFHIRPFRNMTNGHVLIGVWFGISFANNLLLGAWSLRNLNTQFRVVAMERLESRVVFWRKWFGHRSVKL